MFVKNQYLFFITAITGNCHHGTACNGCNTADIIGHGFCCYNCYGAMKIDVTVDGVHCQCWNFCNAVHFVCHGKIKLLCSFVVF